MKQILLLLFLVICEFISFGQTQVDTLNLMFPENAKLSKKFQETIQEQTREFSRIFRRDSSSIKAYTAEFILDKIDHDSNYHYIFQAEYWMAFHYKEMIPQLINRLTDKTEVGLVNTADLIIWERVKRKQLTFYGHGGVSFDDLFTIAGRANRLLTEITGEDFGHVSMYSTQEDLLKLKTKWTKWLKKL